MEDFSLLSSTPSKLRLSYQISSKSTRAKMIKTKTNLSETPNNLLKSRNSITPNRSKTINFNIKIAKLQEELDSEELALKLLEIKTLPKKIRIKQELSVYQDYLENLIQILRNDNELASIGRGLARGWKGFLASIEELNLDKEKEIEERLQRSRQENLKILEKTDQFSQTFIENFEEDLDMTQYINTLHNLTKNISQMQTNRIVDKLNQLSRNLKPVDVPSPSSTPEVPDLKLDEAVENIQLKFKTYLTAHSKPQKPTKKPTQSSAVQTLTRLEDFKLLEGFRQTLEDKENTIMELGIKVRKLQETEESLKTKNKEIEELRLQVTHLKSEGCSYCKVKRDQLEVTHSQVRQLQMTVSKGITVERELEVTKQKLTNSLQVISQNNAKISKLTLNIEDLSCKVQESLAQREVLQKKLEEEGKLREKIELELKKESEFNIDLKKNLQNRDPSLPNKSFNYIDGFNAWSQSSSAGSSNLTPISSKLIQHTSQPTKPPNPRTSSQTTSFASTTPDRKRLVTRAAIRESPSSLPLSSSFEVPNGEPGQTACEVGPRYSRKIKKTWLMNTLKLTKAEFKALSPQDRLELFQILFEHKDKCGSDCDHLRRAMALRSKNKSPLFPTKKYNIS